VEASTDTFSDQFAGFTHPINDNKQTSHNHNNKSTTINVAVDELCLMRAGAVCRLDPRVLFDHFRTWFDRMLA
jgi:hypothetical protein